MIKLLIKHHWLPIALLLAATGTLTLVVTKHFLINFEIVLASLCFPFVLHFYQSDASKRKSWKYFTVASIGLAGFVLTGISTLVYFAAACSLFFLLEFLYGKLSHNAWIFLIISSPFFEFVVKVTSFPLRLKLTELATSTLHLFNSSIFNEGNVIVKNGVRFSVDPECMGLNLLSLCLILALVINSYFQKKKQYKLKALETTFLMCLAFSLSIFANFFRILILIIFESLPDHSSHEIIGLACLILYGIAPYYLITKRYFKKKKSNYHAVQFTIQQNKFKTLFFTILNTSIIASLFLNTSSLHVAKDQLFENISLDGYSKQTVKENVLKLEKNGALIYIKPSVGFYGAHHSPLICWTGSGYKMNNQPIKKTKTINGKNASYCTGILTNESDTLYTSWWFDNGNDKTISQWEWRKNSFLGSEAYRLVNTSANSWDELEKLTSFMLHQNLFNNHSASN